MTTDIHTPNAHLPQETRQEIQTAEDAYNDYLSEHYGPLWGEDNETAMVPLVNRLRELYERYDVDEFDRIAL